VGIDLGVAAGVLVGHGARIIVRPDAGVSRLSYAPAMRKHSLMILAITSFLGFLAAPARAQESGIGVGVETMLTGSLTDYTGGAYPGGVTVTYDSGTFYAGGMLTFLNVENGANVVGIGGRFYYPVHHGSSSDFALGGGLEIINNNPDGPPAADTSVHLEIGGRIRAWLTRNVALDAGVGVGILMADNGGAAPDQTAFGLVGDLVSTLGVTYFFW